MPDYRTCFCLASLLGFGLIAVPVGADEPNPQDVESSGAAETESWGAAGWPLMQSYCLDCHNGADAEAGLDLSLWQDEATFTANAGAVQRVLEMVRFGAMPPEDMDQPTAEERKRLVAALERGLYSASCDDRPRPGKITARRLNRAEYRHSIRDLFGIETDVAKDFPSDEVGAGFDNNADVLSMSPILMEKYLEAAEQIAEQVIVDPTDWPQISQSFDAAQIMISGDAELGVHQGWFVAADAFAWVDIEVPADGLYRLAIHGGRAIQDDAKTTVAIFAEDGRLKATHRFRFFGGGRNVARSEKRIELTKGKHRLFFDVVDTDDPLVVGETVADRFAKLDPQTVELAEQFRAAEHQPRPHDEIQPERYPFLFRQIVLRGPFQYAATEFPDAHNRVVVSAARLINGRWRGVRESASQCLKPVARRAFRADIDQLDIDPYVDLVTASVGRGQNYYQALRVGLTGMLVSPRFLFRIETPPLDFVAESDGSVRLTQYQLATRLSYFLWSSLPDELLLADAQRGQLTGELVEDHVRRMIADPRAEGLATEFAAQWLGLRNLESHEADAELFTSFSPSLRQAMKRETEMLFLHMVRQNQPITALLTADFSFLDSELATHYGIKGVDGKEFRQVSLNDTPRRGVLSHASVLTVTSNPTRTSPVKRGKWILENIFGTPPPDPPAGVPELEDTQTAEEGASLRTQLELHRASPACASCHRVMDQLGFGLEQFDPIGRVRQSEGAREIDASGELPGGRTFDGATELTEILADSEAENFARAVSERLMTFALGRELSPLDRCTVDEIVASTANDGHRWIDLIMEVVRSRQFQYYDLPAAGLE